MIRSFGKSHVGRVRTNNEDSFRAQPELGLFVVADGMGGAQAGERASHITVETLVDEISKTGPNAELPELIDAVERANRSVRGEARAHPELAGMGTTVVAVIARPPRALVVNVGDSRAYLQTKDGLYCVTTDHSWVNEVGRGLGLSDEQLRTHPYRNVLTKAIGAEDEVEVQALEVDFTPGDILLLCSDGLHGVAGEQALLDILDRPGSLADKCEALIQTTLDRGAPDNVTVVLVENAGDEG
jgi:serine/threonine protein phosphatase PrpC